jgi:excisionase family DNA binding protein
MSDINNFEFWEKLEGRIENPFCDEPITEESVYVELEMTFGHSSWVGVSNDTIYKWIEKHKMPAHRMGRLWKFKKEEVDEWVKADRADLKKSKLINLG